jgi:citrate lyase subunit beta/citryl-CoA lyase
MHEKALAVGADEVVFDLEDSVAPGAKQQAREAIATTLADEAWAQRTIAVRINPPLSSELDADLELVRALPTMRRLTVVVPKVETPDLLLAITDRLDPEIGLQALIETPAGIEAAAAIARSTPRLCALILGYADLATALGRRGAERHLERWLYHQEAVLAAARAAGVQAIDWPFLRLGERLALAPVARAVRELGFDGKWAIHPEQVEPLNRVFAASEPELRWAGAVIDALAAAANSGDAAVRVGGAWWMRRCAPRRSGCWRSRAGRPRSGARSTVRPITRTSRSARCSALRG